MVKRGAIITRDLFFIDTSVGIGKKFLINLLLATVRGSQNISIAVTSSGIAINLIDGGKMAPFAFKLPLHLNYSKNTTTRMCNIPKQSDLAEVLRKVKVVVFDESTMAHKKVWKLWIEPFSIYGIAIYLRVELQFYLPWNLDKHCLLNQVGHVQTRSNNA